MGLYVNILEMNEQTAKTSVHWCWKYKNKNKEENDKNSKRKNLQVQFGKIVSRQSKWFPAWLIPSVLFDHRKQNYC